MRHWALRMAILAAACGCGTTAPASTEVAGDGVQADSAVDAGVDAATQTEAGGQDASDAGHEVLADAGAEDIAEPETPTASVQGTVRTEDGQVLAHQAVTCCSAAMCIAVSTDEQGVFSFSGLPAPLQLAIKVPEDVFATPPRAEFIAPVYLAGLELTELGDLHAPTLPALVAVAPSSSDPQTLLLGDGLELTLRRADLTFSFSAVKEEQLGARQIPPKNVPKLKNFAGETLLAVYVIYPFASTSTSPIGVRMPTTLPAGTQAQLRTISEFDGTLSAPVTMTSDGAWLTTDPGAGIHKLTWLIVSSGGSS